MQKDPKLGHGNKVWPTVKLYQGLIEYVEPQSTLRLKLMKEI